MRLLSDRVWSHPVWVRGLKQLLLTVLVVCLGSHPVWVRGLKQELQFEIQHKLWVAPRVGAWIETAEVVYNGIQEMSHPVWVRGLKLGVNKISLAWIVAPRVGAWIETKPKRKAQAHCKVAPRVGAWIETFFDKKSS